MRKRIGDFFLDQGIIDQSGLEEILEHSRHKKLRFGEAAIDLGLINTDDMIRLFGPDFRIDFFQLEAEYFPEISKDLFAPEKMLELGFLPLGFKTEYRFFRARKVLNIGMIEPSSKTSQEKIEELAREKLKNFSGMKFYLILPEQFITVIKKVYGFTDASIRDRSLDQIHERVQLFMEAPQ